jgi:hypothetical protein
MKKEEGAAVDSSAILPYLFSAGRATSFVGQNGQSTETPNALGKLHKIPQMSQLRNAGDFQTSTD